MKEMNIKNYAHIGDAVWELYVREKTVLMTENLKKLHEYTVSFVNAEFHTQLLDFIKDYISDDEKELIRRAGNIKTSSARRINRNLHRAATEFEVLLGYYHIHDKKRLDELFNLIADKITIPD